MFLQLIGPTSFKFPALARTNKIYVWLPQPVDATRFRTFAVVVRTHDPGLGANLGIGNYATVKGIAGAIWPESGDPRTFQDSSAGSATGVIATTESITSATWCGELVRSSGLTEALAPFLRVGIQLEATDPALDYGGGGLILSIGLLLADG